jgi:hypothetical protein
LTIFKKARLASQKLQSIQENEVLGKLRGLPFWIWSKEEHEAEWNKTNGLAALIILFLQDCPRKIISDIQPIYGKNQL